MKRPAFLIAILIIPTMVVSAQLSDTSSLFKTMQHLDSLLFETGFNKCQLSVYDSIVSDDLEFYHDVGASLPAKPPLKHPYKTISVTIRISPSVSWSTVLWKYIRFTRVNNCMAPYRKAIMIFLYYPTEYTKNRAPLNSSNYGCWKIRHGS